MPVEPLRAAASDSVRFVTRFIADEELPAFFRRADVIVLPYARTERFDFSGVLATALAFGKPIVVSDIGGMREVGAVRLVAPGDPEALHEALSELVRDPVAREELGRAAREAAAGAYSWDEAARLTAALYRRMTLLS
jgi:glycosyltransferase involved in cell wall biosynthesis